jgi:ribonuclease P protein component
MFLVVVVQKAANASLFLRAENNIKNRVLRRKAEFESLKRTGRRYQPTSWLIVNYRKNEDGYLRFGLTASTKVGSAVVRNRLKRWCREYFRHLVDGGFDMGLDIHVIFKSVSADFYRKSRHEQVNAALDQFVQRMRGSHAKTS